MSHTYHTQHFFLRHATIAALVLGICTVATANSTYLLAQLTGGGATLFVINEPSTEPAYLPAQELHAAAPSVAHISTEAQIIVGMLLILLGFTLHLLSLQRVKSHPMSIEVHDMYPRRNAWTRLQHWYRENLDHPMA